MSSQSIRNPWWQHGPLWLYLMAHVIATVGFQMQTGAVGWEIYERTHSKWALATMSLLQVIPVAALVLVTGHVLDRYNRKRILLGAYVGLFLVAVGLAYTSYKHLPMGYFYGLLLAKGVFSAFSSPARASVLSRVLPQENPDRALAMASGAWQLSMAVGPAVGGILIAWKQVGWVAYTTNAVFLVFVLVLLVLAVPHGQNRSPLSSVTPSTDVWAGFRYVLRQPLLLGAMTLDLFAVLLGGATTLLPVFAKDILRVGPDKLGWLQAAPGIGALLVGAWMALFPVRRHAGVWLFLSVMGFGFATVIFGLSHRFMASLAALVVIGAFDNVSVVIRSTIEQFGIPDAMRGKVSAVVRLFIGLSNELGGFESGAVAAVIGPVACVVVGGVGSIVIAGGIALLFPSLRRLNSLTRKEIQPVV